MNFKSKNVLLVAWGCENPQDTYMYQIYYLMLKKIFPKVKTFDTKKIYFQYGKDTMNGKFLEAITGEKFDLILFAMENDEFYPETLRQMRNLTNAKTLLIVCDDDAKFDSWSRYYGLFFDFIITSQDYVEEYKKDGIKAFFHLDYNTYQLKPMNMKKKYDVTFIGRPKADRNEVIKYLLDNGIKVRLFGWGWHNYSEFKDVYLGSLSQEDYAKVINQSKINLSPAKAGFQEERKHYNMKGRYFEVAICKSFQLIERFPTLLKFFNEKEIGMYDTEKEMLEKIRYYLKNEKEREKIAERAYKKVLKDYNREKQLTDIFIQVFKTQKSKQLPRMDKKIKILEKKDLYIDNLNEKLADADYIAFKNKNLKKISDFKNYFLSRAIRVTNKPISCCDYYVNSFRLRDYMQFSSKFAFTRIGEEANKFLDINQLMVKKDFFLDNIEAFRKLFNRERVNLINNKNTAFVSIPLVSIKKAKKAEYEKITKVFEMKFPNILFSLIYRKKILTNAYPYKLMLKSLFGNFFILHYLLELKKDRATSDKLNVNSAYIKNSPLEKLSKK
jgi:hypothetical protein